MSDPVSEPPISLSDLLRDVRQELQEVGTADAGREARRLISAVAGLPAEVFLMEPHSILSMDDRNRIREAVRKRIAGMPIGRIVGWRDFYGRPFQLGPATLEPRPDSETLIDAALELVRRTWSNSKQIRIIDVGTGSGCLLLTLLAELPNAIGTGVDLAPEAIAVAQQNAEALGVAGRARFVVGNGLVGIDETFDLLVSNPPYLRTEELAGLATEVRCHDPSLALDGGSDGLDVYRLIGGEIRRVVPQGWMMFEVGAGMATAVCHQIDRFSVNGQGYHWHMWQDLNGHQRCVAARTLNDISR